jgi:mxaL protein
MKRLGAVLVSLRRDADRWLLGAAALALVATFLRPGLNVDQPLFEHVVVFDVTQSMNVEDEQLDGKPIGRLRFAKHALREALLAMPCGSRLGLGIFTEYRSFLLFAPVEVCANLGELRSTLERIDGRMAWIGNSEVAKGLYSGLAIVRQLPATPSLVFVTDGQEAPPLSPRHRPPFDGKRGEVKGLIVGVGDLKLSPIPKTDPLGRPLGYWGADEVLQVDPRSLGRGASVGGEQMTEEGSAPAAPLPGATPGSEHLSSLREAYLQLLANQTGLGYRRLADSQGFIAALTAPSLARPVAARADLRLAPAGIALLLLLARHGLGRVSWRARVRQWRQHFALRARSA